MIDLDDFVHELSETASPDITLNFIIAGKDTSANTCMVLLHTL